MKFFTVSILASLLLVIGSCNSKKEVISQQEDSKQIKVNLEKEGYVLGSILYNKGSACAYIIIDNKSGLKYDPINIDSEKFSAFKVDSKTIYFKFIPLRRMNRCDNIQPIELVDVKEQ